MKVPGRANQGSRTSAAGDALQICSTRRAFWLPPVYTGSIFTSINMEVGFCKRTRYTGPVTRVERVVDFVDQLQPFLPAGSEFKNVRRERFEGIGSAGRGPHRRSHPWRHNP